MNDVKLMGRIGWVNFFNNQNSSVCQLSVATDGRKHKRDKTNWINCVAFGKTAEIINEHYKVGNQICISDAELSQEKWIQDGKEQKRIDIIVHRVERLFTESLQSTEKPVLSDDEKGFINNEDDDEPPV